MRTAADHTTSIDAYAIARELLRALEELRANAGKYQRGQIWQVAADAITKAEAAGIRSED